MMVKTAFLLRGFTLNATTLDADFQQVRDAVASKGYRIVPVPITWNRKTISQFVEQFVAVYEKEKSEHDTVIGGSLGAMAAFVAAPYFKPNELILCSLSPFFKEDIAAYDAAYVNSCRKWFGERRWRDCQNISADQVADQVKKTATKTTMLYGELEKELYPQLVSRVKATATRLSARLVEVPNCGHKMRTPEYIAGLRDVL